MEAEERERREHHHADAQHHLHEPEQRHSPDELELGERSDHEVEQVASPGLFEEAGAQRDLRLVHDVPQDDPGDEVAGRPLRACRLRGPDVRAERAEEQHVDERPEGHVEESVRAAHHHVRVPPRDRAHAQPREGAGTQQRLVGVRVGRVGGVVAHRGWSVCWDPVGSWRAASWRNTPSRLPWPYRCAISSGVPSATMRPCERKTTRSQSRSTSAMS